MVSKWLQERWERLLPMLAPLGCAQEEEIKRICEAELELWRRRPSLKRASSLQKPLTETRHRIRETFPLTQENGWCNPKSGQKEHLSLKYLNFSTQEWRQMAAASERELQERREHPLPLARPWELIGKVEHLLQSNVWPQLVVGIGLATGRGLVEILHTGHFTKKSAYSLLVAAPMTVYEVMSDPFEVPTLVEASQVLAAVHRVRQFFGNHFQGLRRRDISQQCLSHIQEAAYKQVGNLVPLRPLARNMYTSLAHGVYPRLAAWLYCPLTVDTWYYAATIQHHQKFLEATSAEERSTLAQMALYDEYVVLDEHGSIDERRGIRLGEPGVEVLEVFKQTDGRVHGVPQEKRGRAQEEMQRDDGQEREDGKGRAQRDRERRSQVRAGEKEGKTLALQWLEERWHWLIAEMAEYVVDEGGGDEEEEIWAICEAEMAQWRAYCRQNQSMSYQEMMMRTRLVLRTCLPAPWNERWNEEAGEWEHIGLKYLRCREDEWEQMRQDWQDRRVLLPDPELIVARAKGLLSRGVMEAEAWPDLVVGIAVLTGQGLMAILKNGSFSQKTAYSLLFRDAVHDNPFFPGPFEIPTLVRADLVVEAWERVRERVDGTQVDEQVLREQYGPRVCASATESFRDLVPLPAGERELFPALHGSVYPCLATHYYCPPSVESVDYLATICHDPVLLADSSPGARFACAAVCNYMEYRLEDERKGIWLERPGVPIIEPGWVAREREGAAGHAVIEVEFDEEEIAALDEIRQQMGFGFAAVRMTDRGENEGDAAPGGAAGTLQLSMCLRNQGLSPVLYEFIRLGLKHLRGSVAEFVTVCLREEMLEGLKLQQPFETMASSELRAGDPPQVTRQRPHE